MSRVQLALNVGDLDAAIEFYSKLFGTAPAKVRDGYANFVVAEPPLKLVLIVGGGEPGTLNHVGVEVLTSDDVAAAIERFQVAGLAIDVEEHTTCCYAVQDKVWVQGPDDRPWEIYTVLDDADVMHPVDSVCCAPAAGVPSTVASGC